MKKQKRTLEGVCVSNKMDKTITVEITRVVKHPLYKKMTKKHSKIKAHDPENITQIGDRVRVIESKPISKTKNWILLTNVTRDSERSKDYGSSGDDANGS
ncbi:30S ribosomal protein S17 [bacterium]|nr:30S ribosomal protein S17 [bacterium]